MKHDVLAHLNTDCISEQNRTEQNSIRIGSELEYNASHYVSTFAFAVKFEEDDLLRRGRFNLYGVAVGRLPCKYRSKSPRHQNSNVIRSLKGEFFGELHV